MLDPPKPRCLDQPIAGSREDLIPQDHFYRLLEAKLDLSFVRDWAASLSARRAGSAVEDRRDDGFGIVGDTGHAVLTGRDSAVRVYLSHS